MIVLYYEYMNPGLFQPLPGQNRGITIHQPQRVSPSGQKTNLYRIPITHNDESGGEPRKYEIWATKEAIMKHSIGMEGDPKPYDIKKFAHQVYENRLRNSGGRPNEKGVFVSTNQQIHGNPNMWPHTLADTEIKY